MANPKYRPPSAARIGVREYINTYWQIDPNNRLRPDNIRHYVFEDFELWVERGLSATDIARAFGFNSAQPATDMITLYKKQGPDAPVLKSVIAADAEKS